MSSILWIKNDIDYPLKESNFLCDASLMILVFYHLVILFFLLYFLTQFSSVFM